MEIGLQERNGQLEVDIIQARGLTPKPGSKTLPGIVSQSFSSLSPFPPRNAGRLGRSMGKKPAKCSSDLTG